MKNPQLRPSLVALTAMILLVSTAWRDGLLTSDGAWAKSALQSALQETAPATPTEA